jgi:hypothetical protein
MISTVLLGIVLFLYPLGQVGRVSFLNQQVNVYMYELGLFIFLLYLFITQGFEPLQKIKNRGLIFITFPLYLVVVFILSSLFYDVQTNIIGVLYLLRLIFYLLFFIYFLYRKDTITHLSSKITLIGFSSIIVTSFIQYFFYPDLRNIIYLGWDPHLYRMVGTFFDPPIAGAIFSILLFYLLLSKQILRVPRVVLIGILGVMIFLTYSRITYIAFFLTMCLWLLREKGITYIAVFIFICVIGLAIVPKPFGESVNLARVFSIESRVVNYEESIDIWMKSPLYGIGYNRLRYVRESYTTDRDNFESSHAGASLHSSFLIILATGGVIGLILFISMLVYLGQLSQVGLYITLFLSIASLTDNVILHPFILFLYFFLLAREKINHPWSKLP